MVLVGGIGALVKEENVLPRQAAFCSLQIPDEVGHAALESFDHPRPDNMAGQHSWRMLPWFRGCDCLDNVFNTSGSGDSMKLTQLSCLTPCCSQQFCWCYPCCACSASRTEDICSVALDFITVLFPQPSPTATACCEQSQCWGNVRMRGEA